VRSEPELVPLPPRKRGELPRRAVRLSGVELGVIEQVHMPGCRTAFYRALAVIPGLPPELANLELHPDIERQVHELVEFRGDPSLYARHLTLAQRKFLFSRSPEIHETPVTD
jgi:hypothetical protein